MPYLLGAVMNNFQCTADEVHKTMGVVFKQAPDRCGGSGRKAPESQMEKDEPEMQPGGSERFEDEQIYFLLMIIS